MVEHRLIGKRDANSLEQQLLASGLSVSQLVKTAWAAAASYRDTDMRGGVNGARLRLAPQKDWAVNRPEELAKVLPIYEAIQAKFNATSGTSPVYACSTPTTTAPNTACSPIVPEHSATTSSPL